MADRPEPSRRKPTPYREAISRYGAYAKHLPADAPEVTDAKREYLALKLEAHVRATLDAAPGGLTAEQAHRIAALLFSGGAE